MTRATWKYVAGEEKRTATFFRRIGPNGETFELRSHYHFKRGHCWWLFANSRGVWTRHRLGDCTTHKAKLAATSIIKGLL